MIRYFVGLDLGQMKDYTALSVVEIVTVNHDGRTIKKFHVRHLQRFPLGTPYPEIVSAVARMIKILGNAKLIVDGTGVGRPVIDLFNLVNLYPESVVIHGGDNTTHEGSTWRVPKRDLIGVLTVALQTGRMKIASELPEAKTLINELLNFKVKIDLKTAHDSYESWREGIHDDLVLSVALACWAAEKGCFIDLDEWEYC